MSTNGAPMSAKLVAVVLAAGQGTRMRSEQAKVLHPLLGRPMVTYPVQAALEAGADRVVVVVGHQADAVRAALETHLPGRDLAFAVQAEQRGTGHAVLMALDATEGYDDVMILCGDTPALDGETLRQLRQVHEAAQATVTVTSFVVDDPTGYGRVVRGEHGHPARIVEHRDATDAQRAIAEVNAGLYLVDRKALVETLRQVRPDNAQGELYLTDVVHLVAGRGGRVRGFVLRDPSRLAGVNTRAQLAELEAVLRGRVNRRHMEAGVTMHDPASARIEAEVEIGVDTVLGPNVQLLGRTRIGRGCHVEAGAVLRDCELADGVHLKPYVVAEGARLGPGVAAGPFAHLRPGTVLGQDVKVGNFVETKKAVLGQGSKASHLSYLGDCEIGRDVNVGAGTITCNYDGVDKHVTVLEDGVFVGSDTQLVAPVRVGRNATVAAGTTVTDDVPEGALVLSRTTQQVREGYYERRRRPREEAKARAKAAKSAARGSESGSGPEGSQG